MEETNKPAVASSSSDTQTTPKREFTGESRPSYNSGNSGSYQNDRGNDRFNNRKKNFYVKKECYFTKNRVKYIDYKDADMLGRFLGRNGAILPSRITGVKLVHQRKLAKAVKRARYMGLLPFTGEYVRPNSFRL